MIVAILYTAHARHIREAMRFTADHLHVPVGEVSELIAVAYVLAHFKMGSYEGWDGFVDMLEADARSIERNKKES